MAGVKLDIVTAERVVYSEEVDAVIAPGVEGQLVVLPHHAPLMTMIQVPTKMVSVMVWIVPCSTETLMHGVLPVLRVSFM